jgi:23S rRNA-/tRNA-specific pseudouridylate synthase
VLHLFSFFLVVRSQQKVTGSLPADKGVVSGGIIRAKNKLTFTVVDNPKAGKFVKTAFWKLGTSTLFPKFGEVLTGVKCALGTGRQHQVGWLVGWLV